MRRLAKLPASFRLAMLAGLALGLGACSTLLPSGADAIVTGSIAPRPVSQRSGEPVPAGVPSEDWALARLALSEALASRAGSPSVSWENVASATRGTVTPVGEAERRDGADCRGFLVSFVRAGGEEWLQGEACRDGGSAAWSVDQARLLQRT